MMVMSYDEQSPRLDGSGASPGNAQESSRGGTGVEKRHALSKVSGRLKRRVPKKTSVKEGSDTIAYVCDFNAWCRGVVD